MSYSQNYDCDKLLIQTFGRGNLPKYLEPNLSQRNAFEQQKLIRQKYAHRRQNEPKPKQKASEKEHPNLYDYQRSQPSQVKDISTYRNKAHFDNIDHINDKINGLIKSISMSCYKRDIIPLSNKVQKSQTLDKFKKKDTKDFKRDKLMETTISKKTHHIGFDSFGAKQDLPWFKQQKKEVATQRTVIKTEKKVAPLIQAKKEDLKVKKRDDQDQLQERINKIQDKISVYERKMGNLKPTLNPKKQNPVKAVEKAAEKTVERQQPREIVDYLNLKYQNGSKKLDQFQRKQEKTARKDITTLHQKQSHRKMKKEKATFFLHQSQIKKEEKLIQMSQSKTKNSYPDKQWQLQTNRKKITQKEQSHSKLSSSKKNQALFSNQKKQLQVTPKQYSDKSKLQQNSTFLKSILTQIQYDQDFRHAKHMFGGIQGLFDQSYQADREKWLKLKEELKIQGFSLSINEVKQIFMPRDDEIDPFMSVSHSHDELIHGVIFAYRTAQKHWNDHIYRNWTLWELKQSNFTSQNLDRGKKGFVSLEDMTFFINTEMDGNYRNRDLLLIFHRLGENSNKKTENSLSFKVIMDKLLSL